MGLALLQQADKSREHEAVQYVHERLEHLLYKLTLQAESLSDLTSNQLHSSELLDITNVQCLKGFLTLGRALTSTATKLPSHFLKPDEIFRSVASLAVRALCSITHKGELYHQIERTFLEAHSCLLQWMVEVQKKGGAGIQESVVATHCDNLCSLLKVLSLPKDNALLQLQEKVGVGKKNAKLFQRRNVLLHSSSSEADGEKTPCRSCSHTKTEDISKQTPPPTNPNPPTSQSTPQEVARFL